MRISTGILSAGIALACFASMRMGWRGLAFSVIAFLVTVHLMSSYRGTYVWPGTFDLFEVDRWRWMEYVVASLLVGTAGGAILFKGRSYECPAWPAYLAVATTVAAALWAWFIASFRVAEARSEFAPTRHLAYAVLAVLCFVLLRSVEMTADE